VSCAALKVVVSAAIVHLANFAEQMPLGESSITRVCAAVTRSAVIASGKARDEVCDGWYRPGNDDIEPFVDLVFADCQGQVTPGGRSSQPNLWELFSGSLDKIQHARHKRDFFKHIKILLAFVSIQFERGQASRRELTGDITEKITIRAALEFRDQGQRVGM